MEQKQIDQNIKNIRNKKQSAKRLQKDLVAGLTVAISNIPDGMASAALAGMNPVMGLYSAMVGSSIGGILANTRLMIVATTSSAALLSGQIVASFPEYQRIDAMIILAFLTGLFVILIGLLRLGNLVKYVSHSVMTGFLTGVAVLTIISQLPDILGIKTGGSNIIIKTISLFSNIDALNWHSFAASLITLLLLFILPHTKLDNWSGIISIVLPSAAAFFLGWNDMATVGNTGNIIHQLSHRTFPNLSIVTPSLVSGAFALAAVIAIQGAGVSRLVPNPHGKASDISKDCVAQGAANIGCALFGGIPVGGTVGSSVLNKQSGARTKMAAVFCGLWIFLLLLFFPKIVSYVGIPVLAMMMIMASAGAIKVKSAFGVWDNSLFSAITIAVTFLATIFLPIQFAVLIGVLLSTGIYFYVAAHDIEILQLTTTPEGLFIEEPAPAFLPDKTPLILEINGTIFYASARSLESVWPKIKKGTKRPVVILNLRSLRDIDSTFLDVLDQYAEKIEKQEGRVYITETSAKVSNQITRANKIHLSSDLLLYPKTKIIGENTLKAYKDAKSWLERMESVDKILSSKSQISENITNQDASELEEESNDLD